MTAYALTTDDGNLLNAQFELEHSAIVLHSRGGTKGKNETNPDYSVVLRLILRRLAEKGIAINVAWVDSSRVQAIPLSDRMILGKDDLGASPDDLFKRMSARMQKVGRAKDAVSSNGNANKRIRLKLNDDLLPSTIAGALNAVPLLIDLRSQQRLPADELNKVTAENIWNAIQLLLTGYAEHSFGESTDFDLIADDGARLAPKAVFGIAATEALKFKVLPKHFSGGEDSTCFRILRSAGYLILPKQTDRTPTSQLTVATDEHWTEGRTRLVTHVRKERGNGLAAAKKAEFLRLNKKLWCERCGMDPISTYGPEHGEACIEVHHSATQVQHMNEGHMTRLKYLQ
jgi:5-methylcytosine-specific restriction protein A